MVDEIHSLLGSLIYEISHPRHRMSYASSEPYTKAPVGTDVER
jgi:hypothetical protein